ncbi:MAG: PH domain-containing protein [Acidobacteria bacterium]|nr:PH domain-containing protein [Acidobacteriota bacterium]
MAWLRELLATPNPQTYFGAGERYIIGTRRHWIAPLRTMAAMAAFLPLAIALTLLVSFLAPGIFWLQAALWLATLTHQAWLIYLILDWRNRWVIVTDRRLLQVHGVLSTTVDAIHLDKITDSTYHKSLIGHVLNAGTLRIESSGQTQSIERIDLLPCPDVIYRATLP